MERFETDELVAVAKIARGRGLRGELVADILTDFPERFEDLTDVTAIMPDGQRLDLIIEKAWFQNGRVVLKFKGYDTLETSEALRGAEICIDEDEAIELEHDEFYDWELEGCLVEAITGERIGTVKELMRTGGTEVLIVEGETKEYLIPFAEAICVEVDVESKLIKVDPPEGLLEF